MEFTGFSQQEYWSGLPFLPPVDHILSELSTMTCLSLVALHSKAHLIASLSYASPFVNNEVVIHEGDPRRQKEKGTAEDEIVR